MQLESVAVEEFANVTADVSAPGFHADGSVPAMVCPAAYTAAQFVVQGSTICLAC